MARALCAKLEGSWHSDGTVQIAEAKAACARCPVKTACLAWALNNREEHGVWGGLSPNERKRLAGKPKVCAAPGCRLPALSFPINAKYCGPECAATVVRARSRARYVRRVA